MRVKIFFTLIFSTFLISSWAQPMVSYFLTPQSEASRGRLFKYIEEKSEILIKGLNNAPNRVEKHFNGNGLITSCISYNSAGGKTSEIVWEYANEKNLTRKFQRSFTNMRGWSEEEVILNWDTDFITPSKIEVFKNGEKWQWAVMTADNSRKIESAKVINSTGAHIFTERFVYIEASNMIKVMVYRANGVFVSTASYPIDPKRGFSFESVKREYYPNGDVMIETLKDAVKGDQAYSYEYEYDPQGNWIEKRTYQVKLGKNNRIRDKRIENRTTRKISYY
jgi:hypothetical protein